MLERDEDLFSENRSLRQRKRGPWRDVWYRLRKNRMAVIGFIIVAIMVFSAIFADVLTPYSYSKQNINNSFQFPSLQHPFGTDNFGRDILTRVLKGGQISLGVAFISVMSALITGCVLGSTAAYFGGIYGTFVMRVMDVILAMPTFLLALAVAAALGPGTVNTSLAIAISTVPFFVRLIYASVLSIKDREFIERAVACGSSHIRIIFKHIIPNSLAPVIVNVTLRIGISILNISGLSFIGLGVQPPTPEWGSIMSAGRTFIRDFWPIVTLPGVMIVLTLIGFNLLGDGLRDALDPKLR